MPASRGGGHAAAGCCHGGRHLDLPWLAEQSRRRQGVAACQPRWGLAGDARCKAWPVAERQRRAGSCAGSRLEAGEGPRRQPLCRQAAKGRVELADGQVLQVRQLAGQLWQQRHLGAQLAVGVGRLAVGRGQPLRRRQPLRAPQPTAGAVAGLAGRFTDPNNKADEARVRLPPVARAAPARREPASRPALGVSGAGPAGFIGQHAGLRAPHRRPAQGLPSRAMRAALTFA